MLHQKKSTLFTTPWHSVSSAWESQIAKSETSPVSTDTCEHLAQVPLACLYVNNQVLWLTKNFYQIYTSLTFIGPLLWLLVAYWLKHWTADRKVQGSSLTSSRDLFLFWVHSALPQKLSRFSFASFGGDVEPSVPGNPLKLA